MDKYTLIVTCAAGLEPAVAWELKNLGYVDFTRGNGQFILQGSSFEDVCKLNLWLRSAGKVLIRIGHFEARTFDELFEGTKAIEWESFLGADACFPVEGRSRNSTLFSVSDCQAIVKKAIVERLKTRYKKNWFPETGALYPLEIFMSNDEASITLNTSGDGLFKRGYRIKGLEAPIKESLAAGLVILSRWNKQDALADVFCGSGTIPIEAALMALNIAPGLNRSFACEKWDFDAFKGCMTAYREQAKGAVLQTCPAIYAADIDPQAVSRAQELAESAGVAQYIQFSQADAGAFAPADSRGVIVCNPPYGERLGEKGEVARIYKSFGKAYAELHGWSCNVLTSHNAFEKNFGVHADKKRKIFNGNIQCYLYSYNAI